MLSVSVPAGRYIVAVSGGVDSVALLDVLAKQKDVELIVCHVNHGIRGEISTQDEQFVAKLAKRYGMQYESTHLQLGPNASEEAARKARYGFLRQCREKFNADAIIMAHHADDVVETMLINLIRGTGWRGLASLRSHQTLLRPFLQFRKTELVAYAIENGLSWREDITNEDIRYLRNYVRQFILPVMERRNPAVFATLFSLYRHQSKLVENIDDEITTYLKEHTRVSKKGTAISRYQLIMLPEPVALEVLQVLIRQVTHTTLELRQLEAALLFVKTARAEKLYKIGIIIRLRVTVHELIVDIPQN